eukprot:jgi/Ulvmu1/1456/UM011_0186.1
MQASIGTSKSWAKAAPTNRHVTAVTRGSCNVSPARQTAQTCAVALGQLVSPTSLRIQRLVGQGSFGEVFEGICLENEEVERIIMKRVKKATAEAAQMGENEHLLNVYVQQNAPGSCAEFFGYTVVNRSDRVLDKRITPGKWLLWRYQGLKTLRGYMRRKDCINALAVDLRVPEHIVIPTVISHLLQSVSKLHGVGLVHRDVKPSNIILCETDATFRLVDLGAMADLRTGINYNPDESIMDPYYCPPEQYVLPTDGPDLAKAGRVMSLAMSAMLWRRHKPDRFDMYSIGLILLQLSMPHLRTKSALQAFHASFKRCRYDLMRWRTISSLTEQQTAVLDANDGAGWELAAALLRPRKVQVLSDGHVYFTNEGKQRPSAEQALEFQFVQPALAAPAEPVAVPPPSQERRGFLSLFSKLQSRVTGLEDDIIRTAEMAEEATTTVHKLRRAVQAGEASEEELQRAEGLLAHLSGSLQYLHGEMNVTMRGARRAFRQGFGDGSESDIEAGVEKAEAKAVARPQVWPSEASVAAGDRGPGEADGRWSLASVMLSGIQSMGRAVKVSGDVVDRVNVEAQAALAQQRAEDLTGVQADFFEMLEQASVKASARWADVAAHFANDPRFTGVAESERLMLFRSYIRMLHEMNNLRLSEPEQEYVRRMAERVTQSNVRWEAVSKMWANQAFYRAVSPGVAETLFVRHVARLQQAEVQHTRICAAELAFQACLEDLEPPISSRCTYADVMRSVPDDPDFRELQEEDRRAVFEEVRQASLSMEEVSPAAVAEASAAAAAPAVERQSAPQEAAAADPAAAPAVSSTQTPQQRSELDALREEQVRLKAEYERMEAKLREMEDRLQSEYGVTDPRELVAPQSMNGSTPH